MLFLGNFVLFSRFLYINDIIFPECGIRPLYKTGRIVGGKGATFGEFPWQVLVRESTWLGLFTKNKCGGVLISNKYVMTASHCQPGFLASLVAVFGEFDISGDFETRRPLTRNVKRVIVHRKYDPATFENDLALLELESPVKFDAHISKFHFFCLLSERYFCKLNRKVGRRSIMIQFVCVLGRDQATFYYNHRRNGSLIHYKDAEFVAEKIPRSN